MKLIVDHWYIRRNGERIRIVDTAEGDDWVNYITSDGYAYAAEGRYMGKNHDHSMDIIEDIGLYPMTEDEMREALKAPEEEAMSIIRRAAILMKEQGCVLPNSTFKTQLTPTSISISIELNEEQVISLAEQTKLDYKLPYIDDVLCDYFQVAVWKILNGKLV